MQEVIQCSPAQLKKMITYYGTEGTLPPGAVFKTKRSGVTITGYRSGKVLFQGAKSTTEAAKWHGANQSSTQKQPSKPTSTLPAGFSTWSVLGSDEVATGNYFGPLTVCAAFVRKDQVATIESMGVMDSKLLTDTTIQKLAPQLKKLLPHQIVTVLPEKYNEMIQKMNQGKMKAVCHNFALLKVCQQIAPEQPAGILIDQFAAPTTYFRYLADEPQVLKEHVYFITKGEQYHVAVAAASIIARAASLESLAELSKIIGINLPNGAGANVDQVAARIYQQGGLAALNKVAKLHFANTDKAIKISQS